MAEYDFSKVEIIALKQRFSALEMKERGFEGVFSLFASFEGCEIKDTYKIAVDIPEDYPAEIPRMREIGGRTQKIAIKHRKADLRSLHHNTGNGTACLCVKQEEHRKFPPGSDIIKFVDGLVTDYLYGLSYFDREGRWPWPEYSHGGLGLLEFYGKDQVEQTVADIEKIGVVFYLDLSYEKYIKQIRKPNANRPCICGSTKSLGSCHSAAWLGIQKLHEDMKRLRILHKMFLRSLLLKAATIKQAEKQESR